MAAHPQLPFAQQGIDSNWSQPFRESKTSIAYAVADSDHPSWRSRANALARYTILRLRCRSGQMVERPGAELGMILVPAHGERIPVAERSIFDGMKQLDLLLQQGWTGHAARRAQGHGHPYLLRQ
jgi:hypothetical protein